MAQPARGIPWRPGQSGNPIGQLRGGVIAARTLARKMQDEGREGDELVDFAFAVLRLNATNEGSFRARWGDLEVTMKDKRWAAEFIADRGWGKATESITLTVEGSGQPDHVLIAEYLATLTPDELRRAADERERALLDGAVDVTPVSGNRTGEP